MVTRKPVKPTISTSMPHDANPLPYPATPIDSSKIPASTNSVYSPNLGTSPAFDLIDMDEAQKRPRRDSDVSSNGTWDSPDEDGTPEESELPQPLRIAHGKQKVQQGGAGEKKDELPAALRPGPAGGAVPAKSYSGNNFQEDVQSNPWAQDQAEQSNNRFESNNPYLRSQPTGNGPSWPGQAAAPSDQQHLPYQHTGTSQTSWGGSTNPPAPSGPPPAPPVELPTVHTPADEMSKMSLGGPPYPSTDEPYPAHQAPAESRTHQPPLSMVTERTESFASKDSWEQEPTTPDQNWNTAAPIPAPPPSAVPAAPAAPTTTNQAPPYPQDDFVHQAPPAPPQTEPIPQAPPIPYNNHGHSLIDDDDVPAPQQAPQREAAVVPQPDRVVPAPIEVSHQAPVSSGAMPETPRTQASRQRNEHYSIKHINWKDQSTSSMRRSSILTQNANGPCPLLALVNALVLSTPPDLNTALVETLRTREQVSLGLLLDAVFDELMSGRRGDSAQELPDVSELYSFLLALHTGMNVNPRFITPVHAPRGSLDGHSPDLNQTHPMIRAQSKAGAFEETKEMRLYSTFSIPLIHGWVPQQDSSAYEAFERSAQSFEDAQNIQFVEFELEDKLRAEGLSDQEQLALQDIQTIKSFLSNWPTQLTDYGLQTISRTLKPGQIAILFRNDHFSTVYKEPTFGGLMTLVTDAGYGSHDEIVWESLVDVNGAASELFSGDFRVVSHGNDSSLNQGNSAGGDLGWQTVPARNSRSEAPSQQTGLRINNATEEAAPPLPGPRPTSHLTEPPAQSSNQQQPSLSASEQEDHDLALALQLQEEEEDRQRQADQQRRREQELSEQYISRQDEGRPPAIPPRRGGAVGSAGRGGGAAAAVGGRPAVNRPTENPSADPTAPPSYEQYASDRPYREAGSNATTQQGHPLNTYDALRQQQQQQQPPAAQGRPNNGSGRLQGRRRSSQLAPPGGFPNAGAAGGAAGQPGNGRRPHAQPGTVQAAEEKCCVM